MKNGINTGVISIVLGIALLMPACEKYTPITYKPGEKIKPEVITGDVLYLDDTSAVIGGTVTISGSSQIYDVGIYHDTVPISDLVSIPGEYQPTVGFFSRRLSRLKSNTKYFARAYVNSGGETVFGDEISFKTQSGWQKMGSPELSGVTIRDVAVDGASIYLATNNGVFFSPDTGITWQYIGLSDNIITSITVHEQMIYATSSPTVYRTNTGVINWIASANLPYANYQYGMERPVFAGGVIFAANSFYVYRSDDNGDTWKRLLNGLQGLNEGLTGIIVSGSNVIISSRNSHIFLSNDNGDLWKESTSTQMTGLQSVGLRRMGNKLYLHQYDVQGYFSDDDGQSWYQATTLPGRPLAFYGKDQTVFFYGVSPGGYRTFYYSNDGGSTFTSIPATGIYGSSIWLVAVSGNYFFAVDEAPGFFRRRIN
jgi:photosystem II stability/assembly factor-like uncharacterized protein